MAKAIKPQILISTLWIFILFNMVFRDLHQFLAKGYINEMMSQNISETSLLFYGVILEIPMMMMLLSRILNYQINKYANIISASIILLGILSTIAKADLDDYFFILMESTALIGIIITAFKFSDEKM